MTSERSRRSRVALCACAARPFPRRRRGAAMSEAELDAAVAGKYEMKKRLGKGAYGIVWKAINRRTGEIVAVKKIFDAFRNRTDAQRTFREIMFLQAYGIVWKAINRRTGEIVAVKKIFDAFRNRTDAQRTFREIMFLQEFGEHPNIIKLLDVIRAQNNKDIYLIFESMETDLHAVIKKGNVLKDIHKCYILYQLLKATKFIHSGNVIHRDQKPSNILLDADCFVKLCDFGLARSLCQMDEEQSSPALTEYVATRWYRAPEILLSSRSYTKGVDMWSIGCILGELLLGKPLFPGTSTINQIEQILRVIPAPSSEDMMAMQSDYRASIIDRMSSRQRVTFEEILPSSTPLPALDLLKKLLVFNPDKRLTAEEALQHPYVKRFHCPAMEPSLGYDVILPLADDTQLSVAEYRNKLYQMILEKKGNRHPKEQTQKGDAESSQSQPRPFFPSSNPATLTTGKSHGMPAPPLPKHPQRDAGSTASVQAEASNQSKDFCTSSCQRSKIAVIYNPITHCAVQSNANSGAVIRNHSAPPPQQGRTAGNGKQRRQIMWANANTQLPASVQNLSCHPPNTQLHSKDVRPLQKCSKKMFPITANVGAAGDPKASMGSYSQAYGTICKSALQSLPISNSSQQHEEPIWKSSTQASSAP
ncbi:mitogen-activated protein kinase 15 isoform X2 [Lagopus muta]|uniref:mitogen-activated protein kinase 15 isoform X2 n=1 Tax=Lagopus muta TaxID=64668 RepID=UPI0020A016E5|nr:mitogen-activated protein kinase 15 isoform X2 [Lagopus muta]